MTAQIVRDDTSCKLICECGNVIVSTEGFDSLQVTAPISCTECGEDIAGKDEDEL